ncbi:carboxylesterase [Aureobasidium pullulans EXF-150]|uniref:Carboxylic ester hydrolase n=1 Tax=Aureobasidium pullulans EXF-150 TaxID=1043002 RepID=A0A074XFT8_AURPU|nr:carboxylesterase [Aureobasidium pullulans EXF-150]KEQ80927.1 carboxylesterase [Aureobasidium pullulans EXF-150]
MTAFNLFRLCTTLLSLLLVDAHRHEKQLVGATVNTTSGLIVGHASYNRSQVSEYLGIPYAQPPLGSLRFAAPKKFKSTQLLNASASSPDCPANIGPPSTYPGLTTTGRRVYMNFVDQVNNSQSEDCLTLNIWTKASSNSSSKPVLLWIHGGRYTIPGSNSLFYRGEYLADQEDVIIVTINQRVNIFGYPGAPGETQNWVRDNIKGFGGDPHRITIFGQSAGGSAVDFYSYAWKKDPIVAGLVSQSGTALSFALNTPDMSAKYWYTAASFLGCGSSGDVMSFFHPTVDNNTVFPDYASLSAKGEFANIPYLAGNTDYEAGFYKLAAWATNRTLTSAQWVDFILAGFTCPTGTETANRAKYGVPSWRYRNFGEWDNLRLYPDSRAYHGTDITMIFGTAEDVSGVPNSPAENEVSRYMMRAWAAFARDPSQGLSEIGWPEYSSDKPTLARLAYNNQTAPSFVDPSMYDAECLAMNDPSLAKGAF